MRDMNKARPLTSHLKGVRSEAEANKLLNTHFRIARQVANRVSKSIGVDYEYCLSQAMWGLWCACLRWDESKSNGCEIEAYLYKRTLLRTWNFASVEKNKIKREKEHLGPVPYMQNEDGEYVGLFDNRDKKNRHQERKIHMGELAMDVAKKHLAPKYVEMLRMKFFEGMQYDEIAPKVGASTAKGCGQTVRDKLKELRDLFLEDEEYKRETYWTHN